MSTFVSSPYRRPDFAASTFHDEPSWRGDCMPPMAMLTHQWPETQPSHLNSLQHLDLRLFASEEQQFPDLSYSQYDAYSDPETVGTPSTSSYLNDMDSCFNPLPIPSDHLQLPNKSRRTMGPMASPQSSYGSISPTPSPTPMPMHAATPAPSTTTIYKIDSPAADMFICPSETSQDSGPAITKASKSRGNKRARIPHTAVERRYRENLNAHLDKLRQNVPALAAPSRHMSSASEGGVKPSKCEILNGAIDHISLLSRENAALRNELVALRQKVGEFDGWYPGEMR